MWKLFGDENEDNIPNWDLEAEEGLLHGGPVQPLQPGFSIFQIRSVFLNIGVSGRGDWPEIQRNAELIAVRTTHTRTRRCLKHAQTRCCRFHVQVDASDDTRGPDANGRGGKKKRRGREEGGVRGVAFRALGGDLRRVPGTDLDSPSTCDGKTQTRLKEQASPALLPAVGEKKKKKE